MKRIHHPIIGWVLATALALPSGSAWARSPQDWVWDFVDRQMMNFGSGRILGVQVQSMTPELREFFGAPRAEGVLVASVRKGSAAAAAGVRVGDVITAVGDRRIEDPQDLMSELFTAADDGDKATLTLVRDKAKLTVEVKEPPPPRRDPPAWMPGPPWWEGPLGSGPDPDLQPDPNFQNELLDRLERLEKKLEELGKSR